MMAINLPIDLSQSSQNVTTFLTQKVNQVTDASQMAKETLTNSASRAVNALTKSTNQAVDTFTQTTAKAKGVLSETANQAVNSITTTTEQAKTSIFASIKQAEGVGGNASEVLQNAIASLIGDWIHTHPKIFWLVSHPFISLGILFLTILIISGLLKALGQFFEKAWLIILQAPIKLSQLLFGSIYQALSGLFGRNKLVVETSNVDLKRLNFQSCSLEQKERLAQIFSRLEVLNQEQNQLIQEVRVILNSDQVSLN